MGCHSRVYATACSFSRLALDLSGSTSVEYLHGSLGFYHRVAGHRPTHLSHIFGASSSLCHPYAV